MATFTAEEVLRQLDACADDFSFPMLDNGYVYLGDVRLSGYSDDSRWALVIEVVGFSPRGGLPGGLSNAVYCFGNCLSFEPGLGNENILHLVENDPARPAFDSEHWMEDLLPGAKVVRIRGQTVPVPDRAALAAKGIKTGRRRRLRGQDLLRGLLPEYRHLLLATEDELRRRVPADLPLVIRLDEWHHPDLADDERPGDSPTFRAIADVLLRGDANSYHPPEPPNTHWRNWPRGGTL
jgi:hypothetical protein